MPEVKKVFNEAGIREEEEGTIAEVNRVEKRVKSPRLHSLSTLQTKANKRWKLSPSQVLRTVQSLYEKKLVTYPRTDSNYITQHEFKYLNTNLTKYKQLLSVPESTSSLIQHGKPDRRYVNDQAVKEHYAIIPTKRVLHAAASINCQRLRRRFMTKS